MSSLNTTLLFLFLNLHCRDNHCHRISDSTFSVFSIFFFSMNTYKCTGMCVPGRGIRWRQVNETNKTKTLLLRYPDTDRCCIICQKSHPLHAQPSWEIVLYLPNKLKGGTTLLLSVLSLGYVSLETLTVKKLMFLAS